MKSLLFILSIVMLQTTSVAQFNVNKLKNKGLKNVGGVKPSSQPSSSSAVEIKLAKEEAERKKINSSPAAASIRNFNQNVEELKSKWNPNHYNEAGENLASIRKEDPSYNDLPKLEKQFKELETKYESVYTTYTFYKTLQAIDQPIGFFTIKRDFSVSENLYKSKYDSINSVYNSITIDSIYAGDINKIKKDWEKILFTDEASNVSKLIELRNEKFPVAELWSKQNRAKPDFEKNDVGTMSMLDDAFTVLKDGVSSYSNMLNLYPDNVDLKKELSKHEILSKDLKNYKSSGEFDKMLKRRAAKRLAEIRMAKPLMQDASIEAVVKKEAPNKDGDAALRVVIIASEWYFEKNEFGIPLYKKISVQVALKNKDNGQCYFIGGEVHSTYNGSGYESMHFRPYSYHDPILCENVFK